MYKRDTLDNSEDPVSLLFSLVNSYCFAFNLHDRTSILWYSIYSCGGDNVGVMGVIAIDAAGGVTNSNEPNICLTNCSAFL